jgi:two-component system cell cycle sensor histidine kinase/response regulator CckA
VPLESHQEVSGLLVLADREGRDGTIGPFTASDETLLHSFAYQAGIAINNARLHRRLEQAYEQLRQAQKMEALGQLAGGVAHDFNNLLTIINGYSELGQLKTDRGSQLYDNLDEIRQAGTRAASLTRQLLAFTRHQVTQPEVLDLNALIGDMQKMLGRLISESVEFCLYSETELGLVKADPGQIQQIVMNLAINARDAMPRGGNLSVETKNVDLDDNYARQHLEVKPGPYVRFSVGDTGTGMDEETRKQIFTPFFTTKGVGEGTGLGLAMVQSITRQHDGHITVYSEPGIGTTFHIYLPRIDEQGKAVQTKPRLQVPRGTETILLVEDEAPLLDLVRMILQNHGYRVVADSSAAAAESRFVGLLDEATLLITDVVMPGMDGRELSDRLRVLSPGLRVMYISGYPDNVLQQHGISAAADHFLQKPFTSETLVRKVREVIDAARP